MFALHTGNVVTHHQLYAWPASAVYFDTRTFVFEPVSNASVPDRANAHERATVLASPGTVGIAQHIRTGDAASDRILVRIFPRSWEMVQRKTIHLYECPGWPKPCDPLAATATMANTPIHLYFYEDMLLSLSLSLCIFFLTRLCAPT